MPIQIRIYGALLEVENGNWRIVNGDDNLEPIRKMAAVAAERRRNDYEPMPDLAAAEYVASVMEGEVITQIAPLPATGRIY